MAEEKKQHGGKRKGAGRPSGTNQTPISLKLDNDLLAAFQVHHDTILNRSKYINDAIREALKRDNLLGSPNVGHSA